VAANLVPLVGVLALGWSLFPVLVLFWFETLIVGAMSALRILFVYPASWAMWFLKVMCFPFLCFFLIPYAMLVAILTFFVFGLFASGEVQQAFVSILFSASTADGLLTLDQARQVIWREFDAGMLLGIAVLATSHLYSFIRYYLIGGECNRMGLGALVVQPIARVWLMMFALNAGAFGVQRLDAPLWLLAPLIAVKIAVDLYAHAREHRRADVPVKDPAPDPLSGPQLPPGPQPPGPTRP
jgi:hypothetical protein